MKFIAFLVVAGSLTAATRQSDVLIYGCNSAAIAAAIQTTKMGKTVVMACPERHLGGLTSGGLGWTDSGNKAVIGGISREFYQAIKKHYTDPKAWTFGTRDDYKFYRPEDEGMWAFEPGASFGVFKPDTFWLDEPVPLSPVAEK